MPRRQTRSRHLRSTKRSANSTVGAGPDEKTLRGRVRHTIDQRKLHARSLAKFIIKFTIRALDLQFSARSRTSDWQAGLAGGGTWDATKQDAIDDPLARDRVPRGLQTEGRGPVRFVDSLELLLQAQL